MRQRSDFGGRPSEGQVVLLGDGFGCADGRRGVAALDDQRLHVAQIGSAVELVLARGFAELLREGLPDVVGVAVLAHFAPLEYGEAEVGGFRFQVLVHADVDVVLSDGDAEAFHAADGGDASAL